MKVVKRSKLAIISLTLMIVIAGYINYKYDPQREKDLGKTVFVNGSEVFLYQNVEPYSEEKQNNVKNVKSIRQDMYSEMETYYNSLINSATSEQLVINYQDKLDELIYEKYLVNLTEHTIKSYGIDDVALVVNSDNIQVYVEHEEKLNENDIAKIETAIKANFSTFEKNTTIWETKEK